MEKITMASGRVLNVDMVATIPDPQYAYIRVIHLDYADVQEIFSDPEETKMIIYNGIQLLGYTKVGYIRNEGDAIKVRLER